MKTLFLFTLGNDNKVIGNVKNDTDNDYAFLLKALQDNNLMLDVNDPVNSLASKGMGAIEYDDDRLGRAYGAIRTLGVRFCDNCHAWIMPQDIASGASIYDRNAGLRYCVTCSANRPRTIECATYHSSNDWRYVTVDNGTLTTSRLHDGDKGVGYEVEFYNGRTHLSAIKSTNAFYSLAKYNTSNWLFKVEQDCTVSAEIISNVFSKEAVEAFDYNILTDVMKLNNHIEDCEEAGLHVHISKAYLGDTPKEQCLNFLKLQKFMKMYEDDFFKMCGRHNKGEAMSYCRFFDFEEIERMKNYILANDNAWYAMPDDHGSALTSSGHTIEWRIGANTTDPERMKMYIRFLLAISENVKNIPEKKVYCLNKMFRLVPQDVLDYWHKKGCFLKTVALDSTSKGYSLRG